jgi:predicted Zn-dependent peptidase
MAQAQVKSKAAPATTKIDRSKAPKPGPAPKIGYKDPIISTLPNGITLLVVENHKLPKVSASMSIDRGPVLEGTKAGVMGLMGSMLNEGTTKTPKEKFDMIVEEMGASVGASAGGGYAASLTRYFDKAFMMMAEAVQSPAFPKESFDKQVSQKITGLKSSEKNAQAISGRVVNALAYGKNTAMGEFETEETIKSISLDDVKKAYAESMTPSRCYLTFVGDITPAKAKELVTKAFGNWKGPKLELPKMANVENPAKTEIDFIDLPTAVQANISVTNLVSNPLSNPDYHALVIANQILGGGAESKLFMNLREKHGFTYGSYSRVGNGRFQSQFNAGAQVRSEKADSAIAEIMNEIVNMQEGKITEEEIKIAKAKYNGSFALGMEEPGTAATYASNILINNLPSDYYKVFLQKINAVTVADIQRVAKKYFEKERSRIVIVGNASKIVPNLARLGYQVKMYDKYANPVAEKKERSNSSTGADASTEATTPAAIVDNYIQAIGGKDAVSALKTIKISFTIEMMGREMSGYDIKMAPNKHATAIKMGEMTVFESKFDGTKGYQGQMGQKADMEADDIKKAQDEKGVIEQFFYNSPDYKLALAGTEKLEAEEAYKITVTPPSGKIKTEYYSKASGLLLKSESTQDGPQGEITIGTLYADYKKVGNVMIPHTMTQDMGVQQIEMKATEVKINEGVTDADFQ